MANAEHLSQSGYHKLRNAVSAAINGGTSPTADANFHAENLISAGFIDVDAVLDSIKYKDAE